MILWLKALFHRPFTAGDIELASASLLARPPLPDGWLEVMARKQGKTDRTLLDWWRESFLADIKTISERATWQRQRAALITEVLDHVIFSSIYSAAKDASHVGAWKHYVESMPMFSNVPEEGWANLLFQGWLTSFISEACLLGVGTKLYEVDKAKQLEIDPLQAWVAETRKLDVALMELMLTCIDKHEDADARFIAAVKDDEINPLIKERFEFMLEMKDAIANRTLDLKRVQNQTSLFSTKHQELAQRMNAHNPAFAL
jgi:hypothetical protein